MDEWLAVLHQLVQRLWPRLPLQQHQFRTVVSHDVDAPSAYGFCRKRTVLRGMAARLLKQGDVAASLMAPRVMNWSPAKVFMGDVGSTFLGAVFAAFVLQASSWSGAFALLLVATPVLGDACLCVPRRLMAGQRVFQAHRLHLFQRLHQVGWSHARVSSLYIAATALLAIAYLWGGLPWVITFAVLELLIGIWLDQQVAVPFAVASRS